MLIIEDNRGYRHSLALVTGTRTPSKWRSVPLAIFDPLRRVTFACGSRVGGHVDRNA